MTDRWQWDETLFAGSAPYYMQGRPPYAPGLADALTDALGLDGSGWLLDLGCGPGVVTLALADRFAGVIGLDPDPGMLAEAARLAEAAGIANAHWVLARAEELPPDMPPIRVATLAQSFHWMDRELVARRLYGLLEPGGAVAHISDLKAPRTWNSAPPFPEPPYQAIQELVRRYLGPVRRAGRSTIAGESPSGEAAIFTGAGFLGPERLVIESNEPLIRTADDLVAWVYSLSSSTPHLLGEQRAFFETDLRALLYQTSPAGQFADLPPATEVHIWRKGTGEGNR
jgi:SAM-dependent methyltransferase